jgi:hypothetical protein
MGIKMVASSKIKYGKFGLAEDPRGLCVRMNHQGRVLLGRVRAVTRNEFTGAAVLTVTYFCGDRWPVAPVASAVDII